ncbi:MAG TPA: hypothetical protein VFF30_11935 [Nitrososphaerales archaeon]|nr:hypothetical protein [Nitrososphaerales archaeon]
MARSKRLTLSPSKLFVRQAIYYYLLCLPAIVAELVFAIAISSSTSAFAQIFGSVGALGIEAIPIVVLVLSIYAMIGFRSRILIGLLTISFFVSASVGASTVLFGYALSLPLAAALVVIAAFLVLVSFNYARGAKVLSGRKLKLTSDGPVGYQLLSYAFELGLPLGAALGLVLLTGMVFSALKAQAALLPEPLSTITLLYVSTRMGLVLTTIVLAGATIWVLGQVLGPIILYYSIGPADAKKLALQDEQKLLDKLRKESSANPSSALGYIVPGALFGALVLFFLGALLGPGQLLSDLSQVFFFQRTPGSSSESSFLVRSEGVASTIDNIVLFIQNFLRTLMRMLWG